MEPTTRPKTTPKDFFTYLGIIVSLYASAGSILNLLFAVIDFKFPDALAYNGYMPNALDAMRFPLSILLVVFPLFLFLSWYARKELQRDAMKVELWVRKWAMWLTLFVAGATLVGDLIALINVFLGGEITTRFIFKVLAILIVAGAVFAYYFYDLKRTGRGDFSVNKPLLWGAAVGVLAAIVLGFLSMGSPSYQRDLKFDAQRTNDLMQIQNQVLNQWQTTQKMPQAISDLSDDLSWFVLPKDPETKADYEYRVLGPLTFEMCATFALPSATTQAYSKTAVIPSYPDNPFDTRFVHDAGRTCYSRTIDPVKYPPFEKTH